MFLTLTNNREPGKVDKADMRLFSLAPFYTNIGTFLHTRLLLDNPLVIITFTHRLTNFLSQRHKYRFQKYICDSIGLVAPPMQCAGIPMMTWWRPSLLFFYLSFTKFATNYLLLYSDTCFRNAKIICVRQPILTTVMSFLEDHCLNRILQSSAFVNVFDSAVFLHAISFDSRRPNELNSLASSHDSAIYLEGCTRPFDIV